MDIIPISQRCSENYGYKLAIIFECFSCFRQCTKYFTCIISFLNYPLNNCMNACMDALMEWIISSHFRGEKMGPQSNNLYKVPWLSGYQKRNSTWFQSLALYYSVTLLFCYLYPIFPVSFYSPPILKSTTSRLTPNPSN